MGALARFSLANRALIALITVLTAVFGVLLAGQLKQELIPPLQLPIVGAVTSYPGASPEVVEQQVSDVIEQAAGVVGGLEGTTSTSSSGTSVVLLELEYGTNVTNAQQQFQAAITRMEPLLPESADTQVITGGVDDLPVIQLSAASGGDQEAAAEILRTVFDEDDHLGGPGDDHGPVEVTLRDGAAGHGERPRRDRAGVGLSRVLNSPECVTRRSSWCGAMRSVDDAHAPGAATVRPARRAPSSMRLSYVTRLSRSSSSALALARWMASSERIVAGRIRAAEPSSSGVTAMSSIAPKTASPRCTASVPAGSSARSTSVLARALETRAGRSARYSRSASVSASLATSFTMAEESR